MTRERTYTDEALVAAVREQRSWRGVLRALGLRSTSSSAIRSVRRRAEELRCDYTHFRGQRRWGEDELRSAVSSARSWAEVADALGLRGGSSLTTVKGHAARLRIDVAHLHGQDPHPGPTETDDVPDLANLAPAGSMLAAGWFALCGYTVSWPLEPSRYDLLVEREGQMLRIQVKTTTVRTGTSWTVWLSTTRGPRQTYGIDEIDAFFIIDGDLNYYMVPVDRVGGLHAVQLSAYGAFRVRALPPDLCTPD